MRAAAYLGAGTPGDRDRRLEPVRRRADTSGWELTAVYADGPGRRGARRNVRPLLAAAAQHTVDVIIIERLDHLAGSFRELAHVFDELHHSRVSVVSLDEGIDTSGGDGEVVFRVMRALSQFDRRLHGQRIRVGLARARAVGTRVGRPPAGVEPAEVVRLRAEGLSYRQVGRRLGISAALAHRLARFSSPAAPEAVHKPLSQIP